MSSIRTNWENPNPTPSLPTDWIDVTVVDDVQQHFIRNTEGGDVEHRFEPFPIAPEHQQGGWWVEQGRLRYRSSMPSLVAPLVLSVIALILAVASLLM